MSDPAVPGYEGEFDSLAVSLPETATVIALAQGDDADVSMQAATAIAEALGRVREHVLLATLEAAPSRLDALLGGGDSPGLAEVVEGRLRLAEVAVVDPSRSYVYLPAGAAAPGPEPLLARPGLARLAERVRHSGGTLLLYLPPAVLSGEEAEALLDGWLATAPGGPAYSRVPELGQVQTVGAFREDPSARVVRELRAREAPPRTAPPAAWRRHRPRAGFPLARVAVGAAILLTLAGGWWVVSRRLLATAERAELSSAAGAENSIGVPAGGAKPAATMPSRGEEAPDGGAGLRPTAGKPTSASGATDSAAVAGAAGGDTRQKWEAIAAAAPLLPYSVQLASYSAWPDAVARRRRLAEAGNRVYFISPTPVAGAVYYRIYAGATPDSAGAVALMQELVRLGRKETASDRDVRPVGLAFQLGIYPTQVEADAFAERLEKQAIPAYTIPVAAGADTAYQVFAGGFETRVAAAFLAKQLSAANQPTELTQRRGVMR